MEEKQEAKTTKRKYLAIDLRIISVALGFVAVLLAADMLFDIEISPDTRATALVGNLFATPTPKQMTPEEISLAVAPEEGFTVPIRWGDTGVKLMEAGGIDMVKFARNYEDPKFDGLLEYLTEDTDEGITITKDNAYFWVNTLWALGLTQKSYVLDRGVMGTEHKDRVGNFASTGGWTLGARDAVSLYSSADIIPLDDAQQQLVDEISKNIYRPCCGNPTSFPDCNHGMAILGLVELMVSQGFSEDEVYEAALAFNSYWFTSTYMDLAYYFQTEQGLDWQDVDPKLALSAEYSSAPGYQTIKKQIGTIPGLPQSGASCGA